MKINLKQKKLLVTRNEPKATDFATEIEKCNGKAIVTPLINISYTPKIEHDSILENISDYEWLIFTSANGVKYFFEILEERKIANKINHCKFAVVGEKTNNALQAFGYEADFMPTVFNAETMAPEFITSEKPVGPVLLVQGKLSRTTLNEGLQKNAIPFDCLKIYATGVNWGMKHGLQHTLAVEKLDYITFASPSTVDAFMELTSDIGSYLHKRIVCIGTTTEKRAQEYGFQQILVPDIFTMEGMLEVIHQDIVQEGKMNG